MHDAGGVCDVESSGDLPADSYRIIDWQGTGLKMLRKRVALGNALLSRTSLRAGWIRMND